VVTLKELSLAGQDRIDSLILPLVKPPVHPIGHVKSFPHQTRKVKYPITVNVDLVRCIAHRPVEEQVVLGEGGGGIRVELVQRDVAVLAKQLRVG
jgi:hypothetical protein